MEKSFDTEQLIDELKKDLAKRGFTLVFSEECLLALEQRYTSDFENKVLDYQYFRKYHLNILAFIGELHIKTHGGKWMLEKSDRDGKDYPIAIKCKNGKESSDFIPVLNDILAEELPLTGLVTLTASYYRINLDCKRKW